MKQVQDFYNREAKRLGYPARSVFKLKEMLEKYPLVRPGCRVLDVGASPGSFSQHVLELLKGTGHVVGVDISPKIEVPKRFANFTFIHGDVFDPDVAAQLLALGPYHLVMSDAAPSTTGQREVDALRSLDLAERVFALSQELLRPHGSMIIKIFQGGGERELLRSMESAFQRAKPFKPKASRSESFEIYLVGMEKKALSSTNPPA